MSQIPARLEERRGAENHRFSLQSLNIKVTVPPLFFLTPPLPSFPVQTLPLLSCHYATEACGQKQPPCLAALLLFKQTASPPSAATDGWRTQMSEAQTQALSAAAGFYLAENTDEQTLKGFKWKSQRSLFGRVCVQSLSAHQISWKISLLLHDRKGHGEFNMFELSM